MLNTPKGMRLQIGVFGRRNVGKSSIVNALTRQQVSIVSDIPGTTTDPVEKAMELHPLGPVLFMDTAGIDDIGALGEQRVARTRKILERADVALVVTTAQDWGDLEQGLLREFKHADTPSIVVWNKTDLHPVPQDILQELTRAGIPQMQTVATTRMGFDRFAELLAGIVPEELIETPAITAGIIQPGEMAVLVVPIDLEAPKGRLILPQVQTIRDLLDRDACCAVVKERELRHLLDNLKAPPALVVTDSQAFLKVAGDTPESIPLTSFSILFARFKGDLRTFVQGALALAGLKQGDRVLIAEACAHHPVAEDIGRVKIPRWITAHAGASVEFDFIQGHDFPEDVTPYAAVIHCGSCTFNRRQLLTRIAQCRRQAVPITNYGITIAYTLGIFQRALAPFSDVRDLLDVRPS